MANRVETLKSMLEQDPKNTFARYGLAMEYANSGELADAMEQFQELLKNSPDYAAGYYHAGRTLERMEKIDDAKKMYEAGIDVTLRTGDAHTRSELQAALDILG